MPHAIANISTTARSSRPRVIRRRIMSMPRNLRGCQVRTSVVPFADITVVYIRQPFKNSREPKLLQRDRAFDVSERHTYLHASRTRFTAIFISRILS